jgi:hypothetical protein
VRSNERFKPRKAKFLSKPRRRIVEKHTRIIVVVEEHKLKNTR